MSGIDRKPSTSSSRETTDSSEISNLKRKARLIGRLSDLASKLAVGLDIVKAGLDTVKSEFDYTAPQGQKIVMCTNGQAFMYLWRPDPYNPGYHTWQTPSENDSHQQKPGGWFAGNRINCLGKSTYMLTGSDADGTPVMLKFTDAAIIESVELVPETETSGYYYAPAS